MQRLQQEFSVTIHLTEVQSQEKEKKTMERKKNPETANVDLS